MIDARLGARAALALAGCCAAASAAAGAQSTPARPAAPVEFTPAELRRILQHSPLGPPPPDPTNRFADDPRAARLGQALFFDPHLSRDGTISCATCHNPAKGFADGRALGRGLRELERHTPSVWNAAYQRWLFWDGRADSLWAQAVQPIEHPHEMGGSRSAVAQRIFREPPLRAAYEDLFGPMPDLDDAARFPPDAMPAAPPLSADGEAAGGRGARCAAWNAMSEADRAAVNRVMVNVGKALAAYQRRLVSRRAPFDRFVEGLRERDATKLAALSPAAQRGLRLFVGRADCRTCHSGPSFSDGEFHDIGMPLAPPRAAGAPSGPAGASATQSPMPSGAAARDPGRYDGARRLLGDPFNAAGAFSDDRAGEAADRVRGLVTRSDTWGQLRTPSLRNVARTAPYMDRGQLATLRDVLRFYSTLELQVSPPAHHAHETLLRPLSLSEQETEDLLAFLESLTDEGIDESLTAPPRAAPGR